MARHILWFGLLILLRSLAAQPAAPFIPADAVQQTLLSRYPGAEVQKWSQTPKGLIKAAFKYDAQKCIAYFGPDGLWMRSLIQLESLPKAIYAHIASEFTWADLKKMQRLETAANPPRYQVVLRVESVFYQLIYDENGNLLSKREQPADDEE